MTLTLVYQYENEARKLREILAEHCPSIRYNGHQEDGDYVYELSTMYEDEVSITKFMELFYWIGKYRNQPLPITYRINNN